MKQGSRVAKGTMRVTHEKNVESTSARRLLLPSYLCNDHVDDRRLAAAGGFEAALQRILELFGIRHLLAVTANAFGDLHEVRRVDMGAVVEIDFRRDPGRIHLLAHALNSAI